MTKQDKEKFKCMIDRLSFEKEIIELKHKYKMEELNYERESARRFHDMELERQRIRSAEIQKTIARRESMRY